MDIQVLISTTNPNQLAFKNLNFNKLVISQNSEGQSIDEKDYRFISVNEKGLAKSRNKALENAEAELLFIADDDLDYCEGFEEKIRRGFSKYPDADILTFRIISPQGEPYKNYQTESFKHGRTSIYRVSSVEMVLRKSSIESKSIRFDERFGLGGLFKSGEETIFLNDALDAGLNLYFIPEDLVIHPLESSGKILDENYFFSKGALVKRLYGKSFRLMLGIIFLLKQIAKPQNTLTLAASVRAIQKGYSSI